MRKIVKFSSTEIDLTVLCDDGTLWYATGTNEAFKWSQFPPIPQPDTPAPVARPISHKMVCAALYAKWREHPKDGWSAQSLESMRVILEAAWAAEE